MKSSNIFGRDQAPIEDEERRIPNQLNCKFVIQHKENKNDDTQFNDNQD